MHGLKQRDGKFIVRIFGVNDNPKENRLFGMDLEQIEKDLDVKLWLDDSHTLWSAALYPEADTIEEAVSATLNLYAIVHGEEQADLSAWKAAPKKSLCSGFNDADPDAIIAWNRRMADLVAMDEIAKAIRNKVPAAKLRKMKSLTKIQKEWLERRIKKADFSEKMRLHYYLGVILDDEDEVQECFRTIQELSDRFVLIYTGQRRLARNLLRDVVGRYVGNEPESLFALEEIQKTAALMRFELERGNVDGFASLLDYHWELSKKVDAGSSNTLIEQIFSSIEELIDGKLVCGAGGGGFLQVILKKGVTRQQVEERLNEVFMDSLVGVADCRLVWE